VMSIVQKFFGSFCPSKQGQVKWRRGFDWSSLLGPCLDGFQIPNFYILSLLYRIFGHIHRPLNIDKK
jgi:hypothetical protein